MEDDNSMSERILRTIETIFNTDKDLKEFSVVPTEFNFKNKSPVLYEEHNIGLESWCVKYIYRYAYMELFEVRKQLGKHKLSFSKESNLNHLLIGVLLLNPDVSTFWNMKRELVEDEVLTINNELLFTKIVLSYKSKSNETFAYRRWLLNRLLQKHSYEEVDNYLQNELNVCEIAAEKNSNNYHACTHRIWCLENLGSKVSNFTNLIANELEFSRNWVSRHVSEHTSYHYRQYLFNTVRHSKNITNVYELYYNHLVKSLNLINENDPRDILTVLLGKERVCSNKPLEETNNCLNFICLLLFDLSNTIEMLNLIFPNHESLWYHRRYIIFQLIKTFYEYHDLHFNGNVKMEEVALNGSNIVSLDSSGFSDGEKQPKLFKSQPNNVESSMLYQNLIKSEMEFIRKNLKQDSILELAKRHEKWLKFTFNIQEI